MNAVRGLLLGFAVVVSLTSCGDDFERDSAVAVELEEFRSGDRDGEVLLADLTDFDWDSVYLFTETNRRSDIDRAIGIDHFGDDDSYLAGHSAWLVFIDAGEVALAVVTNNPFLLGLTGHPYGPTTTVVKQGEVLTLSDVSTDPTEP